MNIEKIIKLKEGNIMSTTSEREIALWLLAVKMRGVFEYPTLHPQDIFNACVNYVSSNGCKSRAEFESIVVYLLKDNAHCKQVLLEG